MESSAHLSRTSATLGSQHQVQPGGIREGSKIAISREKSCAAVNATLDYGNFGDPLFYIPGLSVSAFPLAFGSLFLAPSASNSSKLSYA